MSILHQPHSGQGGMKAFVVLNRKSGKEAHERVHGALDIHFGASGIQYEVHENRRGENLGEIVQESMRHGFDLVVAAGGDGTVSAVIDGIAGSPIPLGIIPTGTGNLIARELCVPEDVDDAVRLREALVDFFHGSNEYCSSEKLWRGYFDHFAYLARK